MFCKQKENGTRQKGRNVKRNKKQQKEQIDGKSKWILTL